MIIMLKTKIEKSQSTMFVLKGNGSHPTLKSSPSCRTFNFRMLVRGKDGESAGSQDVHCVGYIDQWLKKDSKHQKQHNIQGHIHFVSCRCTVWRIWLYIRRNNKFKCLHPQPESWMPNPSSNHKPWAMGLYLALAPKEQENFFQL